MIFSPLATDFSSSKLKRSPQTPSGRRLIIASLLDCLEDKLCCGSIWTLHSVEGITETPNVNAKGTPWGMGTRKEVRRIIGLFQLLARMNSPFTSEDTCYAYTPGSWALRDLCQASCDLRLSVSSLSEPAFPCPPYPSGTFHCPSLMLNCVNIRSSFSYIICWLKEEKSSDLIILFTSHLFAKATDKMERNS